MIDIPTMVSITKAAEMTGLSYRYLRKLCEDGKIVYILAGKKKVLINLDRLTDYLNGIDSVQKGVTI